MRTVTMTLWLLCLGITSSAQVFQTRAGTLGISGRYNGANVSAASDYLFIHLNYDRAEMHLRLGISTLYTENDSLNKLLHKLSQQELIFTGKMNIAFVQTKSHPKQKFKSEGMLFLNGISRAFSFTSLLEHFPRGNTSCILSGEFVIDLKQFNIKGILPEEEKVAVKFSQLVLKKPGE